MPRPATGRRPDSLFDNRYRYDYVYPRGRSGETLRAYDTQNQDAPVVIKRPALQDAPPIRAGQEASIIKEKRALEQLSGHPVLTELRDIGTFRVGGQTHQYIVMDMAQGEIVETMVLEKAERGDFLPELEVLLILDGLLDLLHTAHEKRIIYNDVDAKHLFWDRADHQLKVIDWGNAIFLDEGAPPTISRATDIYQVGQLMYFITSGGRRMDANRPDPANDLGENVSSRLRSVINRAVNMDANQRYADMNALRQDLAAIRRPLEKNRDTQIDKVRSRLPNIGSQSQLEEARDTVIDVLREDPGYPAARALMLEIEGRLNQLAMQTDLDAARIYVESGNPARASMVIRDLLALNADQPLLLCLLDICTQLQEMPMEAPAGLSLALDSLFKNDPQAAARALIMTYEPRASARTQSLLLAECIALRMPGISLLRPHLARLEQRLSASQQLRDELRTAQMLTARLNETVAPGLRPLLRHYQRVSDGLNVLNTDLSMITEVSTQDILPAAKRAERAADDIVELLEVVGQHVLSDPTRAGNALWRAAAIDLGNPAFDSASNLLNGFHSELESIQSFVPSTDGSNLVHFLAEARMRLNQYAQEITDSQFQTVIQGLTTANNALTRAQEFVVLGGRRPAIDACHTAAEATQVLNPAVSRWFEEYARRIDESIRSEFLCPNIALGRALVDGWDAWDRGRGGEAQIAGERASAVATTDGEKLAVRRLLTLAELLSSWLANDGPASTQRTQQAQERVAALFLPEEEAIRRTFSEQMPNPQIYLKAMTRGVVEPMRDHSAAGIRALFLDYVLNGVLILQQEKFDEVSFWREAAAKTLANARLHPAYQTLDNAVTRRQLVLEAIRQLNNVRNVDGLTEARTAVRAPLATSQLEYADQSIRAVDDALRRWPDGEFRAARQLLDTAIERATAAEAVVDKPLTIYKSWLQDLADSAEILAQARRAIEAAALMPTDEPDPVIAEAHEKLIELTRRDLGEAYTVQLRQWRDTYVAIRDLYTDPRLTRDEKLRLFNGHFAAVFINRQPALPIFRHWQSLIRALPESSSLRPGPVATPAAAAPTSAPSTRVESLAPVFDSDDSTLELPKADDQAPPAPITVKPPDDNFRTAAKPTGTFTLPTDEPPSTPEPSVSKMRPPRQFIPMEFPVGSPVSQTAESNPSRLLLIGAVGIALVVVVAMLVIIKSRPSTDQALTPAQGRSPLDVVLPSPTIVAVALTETAQMSVTPTATPTNSRPVPTPTLPAPLTLQSTISSNSLPTPIGVANVATSSGGSAATLVSGALPNKPVATNPGVLLPTLPAAAASGTYDLLPLLQTLPADKISWNTAWFAPGGSVGTPDTPGTLAAVTNSPWQLGSSSKTGSTQQLTIRLGPDVLTRLLGTDSAQYIRRIDASFQLVSYDPTLLTSQRVFFGAGLENSRSGTKADVRARLIRENTLDVGVTMNSSYTARTQLPPNATEVKISIQRNDDRTLSLYVDNQLLNQSSPSYPSGTPLIIYLYTSQTGVLVNVTSLKVQLTREG